MKHAQGPDCPVCDEKLKLAHLGIASWFRRVKVLWPTLHVSSSWRDQQEQTALLQGGMTRAPWPKSAHNHMVEGKPCSTALDLFTIEPDGIGRWPWKTYVLIDDHNKTHQEPVVWGGSWKSLIDGPHFELASAQQ